MLQRTFSISAWVTVVCIICAYPYAYAMTAAGPRLRFILILCVLVPFWVSGVVRTLPWVNRSVRKWEPEPLRWLGVHSMYQLYRIADEREEAGLQHTSRLAAIADRLTGH